ncbi:glycosyltransferase family 4 protein [Zobellia alginiliquefaciens]|uniref:glycosyltransferase family 4 protein n=1 Tax=Zobellia alginiliquefaciens TaxID=3032586 RepID=UPI0023E3906C|nr:glycosyltransferase family 4 protein [Zobellia alginiliquefaciens]
MKKKNLAFVIHSMASGGAERVVSIISSRLVSEYNVFIFTLTAEKSYYHLPPEVTHIFCCEGSMPSANIWDALKTNYKIYKAIIKHLKMYQIHNCIAFMTSTNIITTLASKSQGIPVIICERNNPYIETKSINLFWRIIRRLVYPLANKLVVQTDQVKTFYQSFIIEKKLKTIPNPINPEFQTLKTSNIPKKNILLNVGRLEYQKGQDVLIRAFKKANLENWVLFIIGEGSLRNPLENLIDELGLKDQVFLLGKRKNVSKYYLSSTIFIFSSRFEGFPNALLEAMYFGMPCISTDCPTGPSEMIKDNVSGLLTPVDNVDKLAKKISLLSKNPTLRNTLSKNAYESVKQYSCGNIISEWRDLIEKLP